MTDSMPAASDERCSIACSMDVPRVIRSGGRADRWTCVCVVYMYVSVDEPLFSLFVKVDIDDDMMRRIDIDGGWVGACEDGKDGNRVRGES